MVSKLDKIYQKSGLRHHQKVVAFAVLGFMIGSLLALSLLPSTETALEENVEMVASTTVISAYVLPEADPVVLRIPKIGLDTEFSEPLGLNEDQTVEVPDDYETVGYYKYGPTPGELGPSVIFGHVDSYEGPAVFFSLGQLEAGDQVYVDRVDGTTATFTVTSLERHAQSGFPTEAVYGNIDHAGLRLITCTGVYDHNSLRYSHNLIVYARMEE